MSDLIEQADLEEGLRKLAAWRKNLGGRDYKFDQTAFHEWEMWLLDHGEAVITELAKRRAGG